VNDRREDTPLVQEKETYIKALAFSPDGKILAIADNRAIVRFWDVSTRRGRVVFDHRSSKLVPYRRGASVHDITFSPNGRVLAIVVSEGVILWDTQTEREVRLLRPESYGTVHARFSPDGSRLLVSISGTLTMWDLTSYRRLRDFEGPYKGHYSVPAYSPDGNMVAALVGLGGLDRPTRLVIWDATTGKQLSDFVALTAISGAMAFSADSKLLATGDMNGVVKVWDVAKIVATPPG
jgi:WD40 repeat protein